MKQAQRSLVAAVVATAAYIFGGAPAQAADYWFLKATPSLKPQAAAVPAEPAIALSAGVLPDGMEGKAYSFDLKTLTQVTAGPGIGSAQYALGGGSLPTGISLSNEGQLAGTPTALTAPEGAGFTVVGTYVDKTGQQVYTIKVGESTLDATQIAAGSSHSCAITTAGGMKCWGMNAYGQLGNGTKTSSTVPVQVFGLTSGVTQISASDSSCAVHGGSVKCWGLNFSGQLGNGTKVDAVVPQQVSGLTSGMRSVSLGSAHACALSTAGAVTCWGTNTAGELGDGTQTSSTVPVQVTGLQTGATAVSSGNGVACAIVSGSAKCWGSNGDGTLGNGGNLNSSVPVQVSGLTSGVSSLGVGAGTGVSFACAVTSGVAKCWGNNAKGQLGNGTTNSSNVPVQALGLTSGVTSISTGGEHTCALHNGVAKCWGHNGYGQLGDGTITNASAPVLVSGQSGTSGQISAGAGHTCALLNGSPRCWGRGGSGRLGNGSTATSRTPVVVKAGN